MEHAVISVVILVLVRSRQPLVMLKRQSTRRNTMTEAVLLAALFLRAHFGGGLFLAPGVVGVELLVVDLARAVKILIAFTVRASVGKEAGYLVDQHKLH